MNKNINNDEKKMDNRPQAEEGKEMPAVVKNQETYKGLSLSSKKLNEITVKPKVKNGKVLFDKNNKDHRYIIEEEN